MDYIVYALSQNRRGMIINLLKGKTLNALLTFPKTLGPELSLIKIKKEQIMSVPSNCFSIGGSNIFLLN